MTPPNESDGWRVVIQTWNADGSPCRNVYRKIPGDTPKEAIDFVLEHYIGPRPREFLKPGERPICVDYWDRVVRAWAVPEDVVVETITIEPIHIPVPSEPGRGISRLWRRRGRPYRPPEEVEMIQEEARRRGL